MKVLHARDVPEARSRLLRWLELHAADLLAGADLGSTAGDRSIPPVVRQAREAGADSLEAARVYARWVAAGIRAAGLYFVSEEFTDLAESASRTLPDFGVHRQMLPSESGLLCWARPVGGRQRWPHTDSVRAVAASWRAVEEGVFVQLYDDGTELVLNRPPAEREAVLAEMGWLTQAQALMLPWSETVVVDPPERRPVEMTTPMMALITSWLLMGQSIATVVPDRLSGRDARRIARRGHPVGDVDYVALRRASPPPAGEPTGASEPAYRNRWIVDGHWRSQWYPSVGEHRPIWISAHIKGPQGAPLLTRERVYTLRR